MAFTVLCSIQATLHGLVSRYYAAASIEGLTGDDKLHMSLTYMHDNMEPWPVIERDLATIPLPFLIRFTRVIKVGMTNEITAVEVDVVNHDVENAIADFHYKHVDHRHVSASHLLLHVTSKGYENELIEAGKYRVTDLYIKERGSDSPVISRTSK